MTNPTKPFWVRTQVATAMDSTDTWDLMVLPLSECAIGASGRADTIAELTRDWPSRYHGNGVGGTVVDREAPKSWSVTIWKGDAHTTHNLKTGISVAEAKKAVMALLAAA